MGLADVNTDILQSRELNSISSFGSMVLIVNDDLCDIFQSLSGVGLENAKSDRSSLRVLEPH